MKVELCFKKKNCTKSHSNVPQKYKKIPNFGLSPEGGIEGKSSGALVLVARVRTRDSLTFEAFPFCFLFLLGQKVKVNLPNGAHMTKKKTEII